MWVEVELGVLWVLDWLFNVKGTKLIEEAVEGAASWAAVEPEHNRVL